MRSSSSSPRKWASLVSFLASRVYFTIIIFQAPLFRIPCRKGICTTPMEVTCMHLFVSRVLPAPVVKCLLYPGAIARAAMQNKPVPSFDLLLHSYNFTSFNKYPPSKDLHHLEVLVGCYLCVAGAIMGSLKAGRICFFGMVLLLWGISKEMYFRKPSDPSYIRPFHIYPSLPVAVFAAFLSIRKDVRKIVLCFKPKKN